MPKEEERISGALQENLLTLLCFDDDHCKIIRAAVAPSLFESAPFRDIAGMAIDFVDQFGEAIKEHLPDHLEGVLKGDDERKAKTYQRLLDNLYQSKDSINATYVISQLHKFVRQQRLKTAVVQAVEALEDGRVSDAEVALQKGMKAQAVAFDGGLNLSNPEDIGRIYDKPEEEGFELGIAELDRLGIFPRRKELFSLVAPRKRGKSWFITHCCKQALVQRWSVLVITLELSETNYGARMIQSFFSIAKSEAKVRITKLVRDKDGDLEGMLSEEVERMTMKDQDARGKIMQRAKREFKRRKQFRIKSFPMHSLTMMELEAYVDGLERFEGFTPDLICVDYPRLMKHDAKNLRVELGQTLAQLRGLAQARNAAMVVVHQGNRESEKAALVTGDMAEEDISIVASSDVVLTYSQTPAEHKLGLARLFADYVRNSEGKALVLITQAYAVGQFCLDSMRVSDEYQDLMKDKTEREQGRRRRTRGEAEE